MKYSIVLATHNRLASLKKLVESIHKNTDPEDYEIIVVDDKSTDGTREWLSLALEYAGHPYHYAIFPEFSSRLADSWNMGCSIAQGEFIQIMNDDLWVTDKWLSHNETLYEMIEEKGEKVGVLQSQTWCDDYIQSMGGAFRGIDLVPVTGDPNQAKEVDYSNTPFFRRELFWQVGGFTSFSKIYYEDPDFALSLQKMGYHNFYNPFSVIHHETLGQKPEHGEEEVNRRHINENVYQKEARIKFTEKWAKYLETEHKNLY